MGWTTNNQGSMPGRGRSSSPKLPDWLLALDLSSFLLSGYQDSFSRWKDVRRWSWPLTTPTPNPTSTPHSKLYHNPRHTFTACNTASLHTDIILLFQNLSLEIRQQPTHKLVHSSLQSATYTQVSAQYHKHITHSSFLRTWLLAQTHSIGPISPQNHAKIIKFHEFRGLISQIWMI